jgi:hypothetical protein
LIAAVDADRTAFRPSLIVRKGANRMRRTSVSSTIESRANIVVAPAATPIAPPTIVIASAATIRLPTMSATPNAQTSPPSITIDVGAPMLLQALSVSMTTRILMYQIEGPA